MLLLVNYESETKFDSFTEQRFSVTDQDEKPLYMISLFNSEDGGQDAYIVNEQTGYADTLNDSGLIDTMKHILNEVAKDNPDLKLFNLSVRYK